MRRACLAILFVALSACRAVGGGPTTPTSTPSPTAVTPASISFHTLQDRCCWIEGSFSYASLEGPTRLAEFRLESKVEAGEFDPNEPLPIGDKTVSVEPGHYLLTVWQRPCDGNCGYLDPPAGTSEAEINVAPGQQLSVRIMFRLGMEASVTVGEGA
ncbi:MAG TPA: hypothetical protein VF153_03110 [Candidatus Limnocylindria bacterium]